MNATENRSCLACGKQLKGRIDKKFCDDYCRNQYNNQLKAKTNYSPYVRNINNVLMKNRRVLESILGESGKSTRIHRERLLEMGFHFKYLTHTTTTRSGKTYSYCYDFGYLPLPNDSYLVVRKKED